MAVGVIHSAAVHCFIIIKLESDIYIIFPIYAAPLRAPKWYKRPVGVSFGFGGKLVSFHSRPHAPGSPGGASEVSLDAWLIWCIFML